GEPELRAVGGDEHLVLDDRTNVLGHPHPARGARPGKDERELVAAPAPGDVALADRRPERVRDPAQRLVAEEVAVAVVDVLEAVEIAECDADLAAEAADPRQLEAERVLEPAPVRKPGQAVDERLLLDETVELGVVESDHRL